MQSSLNRLMNALTSIDGLRVYHYWRPQMNAPFCVWQEDGEADSFHANNFKKEQVVTGTVDYFTLVEFDETVDEIQAKLNSIEVLGWRLNSVNYEDDTNMIHYEWEFEISGNVEI